VGKWIYVEIANQGDPIASDELERVFDRFYRADASRRQSEGSGLGLAIVRETILAHGGAVAAGSDEEVGTRFRVWLPVAGDARSR
jgi:signal transduction histidine kinase